MFLAPLVQSSMTVFRSKTSSPTPASSAPCSSGRRRRRSGRTGPSSSSTQPGSNRTPRISHSEFGTTVLIFRASFSRTRTSRVFTFEPEPNRTEQNFQPFQKKCVYFFLFFELQNFAEFLQNFFEQNLEEDRKQNFFSLKNSCSRTWSRTLNFFELHKAGTKTRVLELEQVWSHTYFYPFDYIILLSREMENLQRLFKSKFKQQALDGDSKYAKMNLEDTNAENLPPPLKICALTSAKIAAFRVGMGAGQP